MENTNQVIIEIEHTFIRRFALSNQMKEFENFIKNVEQRDELIIIGKDSDDSEFSVTNSELDEFILFIKEYNGCSFIKSVHLDSNHIVVRMFKYFFGGK
jgi:ATP phosphoribosyltransferase